MTTSALFSTYLHNAMTARHMTLDEFIHDLGDSDASGAESWLNGWTLPKQSDLPRIAVALRKELTEVATGWLIDCLPELHAPLYGEILAPRASVFPAPNDLALRGPVSCARDPRETMDVGDPHDVDRKSDETGSPSPEKRLRKRSPASRAR